MRCDTMPECNVLASALRLGSDIGTEGTKLSAIKVSGSARAGDVVKEPMSFSHLYIPFDVKKSK